MVTNDLSKIPTLGSRGFLSNTSGAPGSTPIAKAGRESVTKLMNSNCTAINGTEKPPIEANNTVIIADKLPESRYIIAFLMFSKTVLPLATALMMVAKLSSAKIMLAASLDTSVPVIPMATPMSAFFKAGASLTPSPVIETI